MATMDATQVGVGAAKATGAIWIAPQGTTLPTDATTTLASAFKTVGFVGEDGVTNSKSRETMEIKEWGGESFEDGIPQAADNAVVFDGQHAPGLPRRGDNRLPVDGLDGVDVNDLGFDPFLREHPGGFERIRGRKA